MRRSLWALALLPFGCPKKTAAPSAPDPGTVNVEWKGSQNSRFTTRAIARWCPSDTALEVFAIRGDTGVGFALFVKDSIHPVSHPIISPTVEVPWRPMSMASLRWLGDNQIIAFQGARGVVNVSQIGNGSVSGTIDAQLRSPTTADTVHLTGSFTQLPVQPAKGMCGRISRHKA
jgi:hypothetical protein